MQIPVEIWTFTFTYIRLNDLIEISCVCKEFYYICEKTLFFFKKLRESKRIFKERDWILSHYKQLFHRFYFNLFRQLVPYVSIENLDVFEKINYDKLDFSLLPFRIWNHVFHCCRSQYESNTCLFCTKLYLTNKNL